jgi:hypothetical protein
MRRNSRTSGLLDTSAAAQDLQIPLQTLSWSLRLSSVLPQRAHDEDTYFLREWAARCSSERNFR